MFHLHHYSDPEALLEQRERLFGASRNLRAVILLLAGFLGGSIFQRFESSLIGELKKPNRGSKGL